MSKLVAEIEGKELCRDSEEGQSLTFVQKKKASMEAKESQRLSNLLLAVGDDFESTSTMRRDPLPSPSVKDMISQHVHSLTKRVTHKLERFNSTEHREICKELGTELRKTADILNDDYSLKTAPLTKECSYGFKLQLAADDFDKNFRKQSISAKCVRWISHKFRSFPLMQAIVCEINGL